MERGRWLTLAANLELGTLARLAPALVATELALLAVATRDGWLRQKLGSARSAIAAAPAVARQRRVVQASRSVPDREVLRHFETRLGDEFGVAAARRARRSSRCTRRSRGFLRTGTPRRDRRASPGVPGRAILGSGITVQCARVVKVTL